MGRKILMAVLLLLAAALVATPQTNTFCANNLPCTVTALWNFNGGLQSSGLAIADVSSAQALTSKTFDISANTLKNGSNTVGHYPRNNGTQYVDGTIATADLPVQTLRTVSSCATAASQFATCGTTITWSTAFADTSYAVSCTGKGTTSGLPAVQSYTTKTASSIVVVTVALTAAAAQFTSMECIAVHD